MTEQPFVARFLAIAAPIPTRSHKHHHLVFRLSGCRPREPPVMMASLPSSDRGAALLPTLVDAILWYPGRSMMNSTVVSDDC